MNQIAPKIEKLALRLAIVSAAIIALLCLFFMTAEIDEAWVIASTRQGFNAAAIPKVPSVLTTGGLYTPLVGLSGFLPFDPILMARFISFCSVFALLVFVVRTLGPGRESQTERLIILATCVAAPGTILMAGMGYGIALAMLLFIAGLQIALRKEKITIGVAVVSGCLIGLALATRWTLIPALPAVLLLATINRDHWRGNLIQAIVMCVVAVGVLLACVSLQAWYMNGAGPASADVAVDLNVQAAGISGGLPHPSRILTHIVSFLTVLPVTLLVVAIISCFALRTDRRDQQVILVFLCAAILIALAWTLRAPKLHLRYIWPAYLMISMCAGVGLAAFYRGARAQGQVSLAMGAVMLPVALVTVQLFAGLRLIAAGAAMQVNSAGMENLENHYKPLHLYQEQRAIVRYLRDETPPGTVFASVRIPSEWSSLELALLSERNIHDYYFARTQVPDQTPDYLIVHRFSPFNSAGQIWVQSLGEPTAQVEGYTIYPLAPDTQIPDPETITLDKELYRFSSPRTVSLTGW